LGATSVFAELQDALNTIWEVKPNPKAGVWDFVKARSWSFGMVVGIGFLLLVSLLISAALAAATKFLGEYLPVPGFILQVIFFLVSFAVTTALFAMMFKILPDARIRWHDVWIGAGMTALLFSLGKLVIGIIVGRSVTVSAYGTAASLVIVIAWIYYSAMILYFGAEFTHAFAVKYGSGARPEADAQRMAKPRNHVRI
jgi:membrane protein